MDGNDNLLPAYTIWKFYKMIFIHFECLEVVKSP